MKYSLISERMIWVINMTRKPRIHYPGALYHVMVRENKGEKDVIKSLDNTRIEEIMDIWLKTNITAHNFIPEQYWVNNYNIVKSEYMPIATTFIYEDGNIIKGFISIMDDIFIGALFVLEEYQGQGIGKSLLNYCKSLYPSLELAVYIKNINAFNFYKHNGFKIVREQANEDSGFMEHVMKWIK